MAHRAQITLMALGLTNAHQYFTNGIRVVVDPKRALRFEHEVHDFGRSKPPSAPATISGLVR